MQLWGWLGWRRWWRHKRKLLFRLNTKWSWASLLWLPFSFIGGQSMDSELLFGTYRLWSFSKYPLRKSSQGSSGFQSAGISKNCWTATEDAVYNNRSPRKWRKRERSEYLNNDWQFPTINEMKHHRSKRLRRYLLDIPKRHTQICIFKLQKYQR